MSDTIVRLEEARVRERAYFLWEREGRPHGRAEAHWHRAAEAETAALRTGAGHEAASRREEPPANGAGAAATPPPTRAAVRRRPAARVGAASGAAPPRRDAPPERPDAGATGAAAEPDAAVKQRKANTATGTPRRT
jgi:hypothetical protein